MKNQSGLMDAAAFLTRTLHFRRASGHISSLGQDQSSIKMSNYLVQVILRSPEVAPGGDVKNHLREDVLSFQLLEPPVGRFSLTMLG